MRTVCQLVSMIAAVVLCASAPVYAQDTPAESDEIAELQLKDDLAPEEQATLRSWLEARVQVIASGDAADAGEAAAELRNAYAKGATGFKDAYAAAFIELVGAEYKRAPRDAATRLIALLNTLDKRSAYKTLITALSDKRVPVRTAAAVGLRRLRPLLSKATDNSFAETITALADAGRRETSVVSLNVIYGGLDYTGVGISSPNPKVNAAALLGLLDARGKQYAAGKVSAEAGDDAGLKLAKRLLGQYNDDEKRKLISTTAAMLNYAVARYTSDLVGVVDKGAGPVLIAERNRFEQFIATAEDLLEKLTTPQSPPGVAQAMRESVQDDKRLNVSNAMKNWGRLLSENYQIRLEMDSAEEDPEP